jgi:aryl-alcohol dehydrogenase-like predicted oxidoreductase
VGARNLEQLEGSLSALDVDMTSDLRRQISGLSPTPPPATDRSEAVTGNWT